MLNRVTVLGSAWVLLAFYTTLSLAATPSEDFNEAIRLDLEGKTQLAFTSYLRAAKAGLPQAQFNVAVMLDSGRGVASNINQAALWYARAAAHGDRRAAYNMGQLYETGQGVPQNHQMARAWFAASGLAASAAHLVDGPHKISGRGVTLKTPELIAPAEGTNIVAETGGLVMVWASTPQPVSVKYYVELRSLDASGSHEVFSRMVQTSSVFATLPRESGNYAWRVLVIADETGSYLPSEWLRFNILRDDYAKLAR